MANKPGIPKGTRDFSPVEMAKRNYIFDTIKEVYALYGFRQIETPAMENLSTLMGKYGEEGDKLLFKILNSGDFLSGVTASEIEAHNTARLAAAFCEKGLRYDLTVPFARYVVQHRDELQMPFKRYQIQPVWRADRPQKGRYREFYQCDADVVGSDSLLNEVELMQIVDTVFSRFGIRVCIKINNRKILSGIAEVIGEADKIVDITVAIDKLDKIGIDKVNEELRAVGLSEEAIQKLQPIINLQGSNADKLATMRQVLAESETGLKGIDECDFVLSQLEDMGLNNAIELDLTLARGLNYYTGCIFEVKALDVQIGSITGGGRYDNLTGIFGLPGLSGVGISFGADRIYDVLNQLDLYPKETQSGAQLLFINFGATEAAHCLKLAAQARRAGIRTIMITGDHKVTASAIAEKIGIMQPGDQALDGATLQSMTDEQLDEVLPKVSVYARVSPEHKIRIVEAWQRRGSIVSMTGDGVNDAPALKRADIGVAMGITGTEVSKDAASMILADDNFATIVKAVVNGRSVYTNIKNAIQFLLSGNTAGIFCVLYASLLALPVPFQPVHLLFINLLTDSLPAIAIGMEPARKGLLKQKPRDPKEPILNKSLLSRIGGQGLLIAIVTMIAFYLGYQGGDSVMASTMAFATLTLARLFHGFNCRGAESIFKLKFSTNRASIAAFFAGVVLLLAVLFIPGLKGLFMVAPAFGVANLGEIVLLAFLPTLVIQIIKVIGDVRRGKEN